MPTPLLPTDIVKRLRLIRRQDNDGQWRRLLKNCHESFVEFNSLFRLEIIDQIFNDPIPRSLLSVRQFPFRTALMLCVVHRTTLSQILTRCHQVFTGLVPFTALLALAVYLVSRTLFPWLS